jgi:hypothetical protein
VVGFQPAASGEHCCENQPPHVLADYVHYLLRTKGQKRGTAVSPPANNSGVFTMRASFPRLASYLILLIVWAAFVGALDDEEPPVALLPPATERGADEDSNDTIKIELGGEAISLGEELGPMIMNKDGTVRRIANWKELSDHERKSATRRITRRNNERMAEFAKVLDEKRARVSQPDATATQGHEEL